MAQRIFLSFLIATGVYLAIQFYFPQGPKVLPGNVSSVSQITSKANSGTPPVNGGQQKIENTLGSVFFSNQTGGLKEWTYREFLHSSLGISAGNTTEQIQLSFNEAEYQYLSSVAGKMEPSPGGDGFRWSFEDDKVKLVKEAKISRDSYFFDYTIYGTFKQKPSERMFVSLNQVVDDNDAEKLFKKVLFYSEKEATVRDTADLKETVSVSTPLKWTGVVDRYFLLSILPQGSLAGSGVIQGGKNDIGSIHWSRVSLSYPLSGPEFSIPLKVFFGPKQVDLLRTLEPTLTSALDFGWLAPVAYPILRLMNWIYSVFPNYGLAIILLTILIKVMTFPLNFKSMKSMKRMQILQPQIKALQERNKADPTKQQQELLTFMKSNGYNPLSGCLPILIQLPIFFALYRVLERSVELFQAPFIFWIHDLSIKDPLYITPVLLIVTYWAQQKLTPATGMDPAQQKVMQFMPIMFGVMMIALPSGLTIYMLVNALATITQQLVLNRVLDSNGQVRPLFARAT